MHQIPTLETERLILRPLVPEDHIWAQKLFPQFAIVKYLNPHVPWPYPDDGMQTFYKDIVIPRTARGELLFWVIVDKSNNTPMGAIEIRPGEAHENRGFWLGLPFHGKGFMSEAVIAVTDYAFDVLGLEKMILGNARDNAASGNIKIKSGATLLREEESAFAGGTFIKQVWEQTPENWRNSPLKQKGKTS